MGGCTRSPTADSRGPVLVIASVCICGVLNDGSYWLKMKTLASIDVIYIRTVQLWLYCNNNAFTSFQNFL